MDMFVLNGAALNGSTGVSAVQASANISAGADLSSTATRVVNPSAAASASAGVTAQQTLIQAATASSNGTSLLTITPTHQQAALADASGSAALSGYVLRTVQAGAGLSGNGTFTPIPASLSASASVVAGATLSATGTPVIAAAADAVAGASASVSAAAFVIRNVSAGVSGAGALRPEVGVNGVFDAYSDVRGCGVLATPDAGIFFANAAATITPLCVVAPAATTIQAVSAAVISGADASVLPASTVPGAASVSGASGASGDATRVVQPNADIVAACILSVGANQRHAAAADNTGAASAVILPFVIANAEASASTPNATFGANATANRMASASPNAAAGMTAAPTVIFGAGTANSTLNDTAVFVAEAAVLRFGESAWGGGADVAASPLVTKYVTADVSGVSQLGADGLALRMAEASAVGAAAFDIQSVRMQLAEAAIAGDSDMQALARTNVEAQDPPERTLRRPATMREVRRPFTDRTMRKAA